MLQMLWSKGWLWPSWLQSSDFPGEVQSTIQDRPLGAVNLFQEKTDEPLHSLKDSRKNFSLSGHLYPCLYETALQGYRVRQPPQLFYYQRPQESPHKWQSMHWPRHTSPATSTASPHSNPQTKNLFWRDCWDCVSLLMPHHPPLSVFWWLPYQICLQVEDPSNQQMGTGNDSLWLSDCVSVNSYPQTPFLVPFPEPVLWGNSLSRSGLLWLPSRERSCSTSTSGWRILLPILLSSRKE